MNRRHAKVLQDAYEIAGAKVGSKAGSRNGAIGTGVCAMIHMDFGVELG